MLKYKENSNEQLIFSIGTICKNKKKRKERNCLHWASRGRSVFLHQQVSAENMDLYESTAHKLEC